MPEIVAAAFRAPGRVPAPCFPCSTPSSKRGCFPTGFRIPAFTRAGATGGCGRAGTRRDPRSAVAGRRLYGHHPRSRRALRSFHVFLPLRRGSGRWSGCRRTERAASRRICRQNHSSWSRTEPLVRELSRDMLERQGYRRHPGRRRQRGRAHWRTRRQFRSPDHGHGDAGHQRRRACPAAAELPAPPVSKPCSYWATRTGWNTKIRRCRARRLSAKAVLRRFAGDVRSVRY